MKKKIALTVTLFLILLTSFSLYSSRHFLKCSYYSIEDERIAHPFRIVMLSDLHNSIFGENNEKLVQKVMKQDPNIVMITGDLINETEKDLNIALELIEMLSKRATVYVSMGNHEINYQKRYGTDIAALYEKAGAKVLDFEYEDIEVNGQMIRLGGVYGYCLAERYLSSGEAKAEEVSFLKEFQGTDLYIVLMCHMPVTWIINGSLNEWDCDLVLCGHAHGGQIRIPFIGGLYAPDQGYFCGKEEGLYYSDDHKKIMVLTRGLGNTENIPRINNTPEIVVIDIKGTE